MLIKSKQPSIAVKRNGNISFEYKFENEPVEVKEEHYEILNKEHPNLFEIVKEKKSKEV